MTDATLIPPTDVAPVASPVIVLDNVSKVFSEFVALEETSFSIAEGEFFSMLGPSGCGKTTTLRMIAGFEAPTSGRILLEGEDVSATPPYRRDVNTVFQQYALFPHMDVRENISYGLKSKKVERSTIHQRVDAMLEIVRLTEFADRKPAQMSGGQQQRVALARALVNMPKALLLDEPLGALDLKLRQTMQLELKRIQREVGITFIFVTHDQEEALTMSDRIAVMNRGRVEQIGSPIDIYDHPASTFVAGFIGSANLWPVRVMSTNATGSTLRLGDVSLPGPSAPEGVTADSPATLMVRPERMRVTREEPETGWTGAPCTITDFVFQGPVVRFELAMADGATAVAHVAARQRFPLLEVGERVWVTWEPDAAVLLPPATPTEIAAAVDAATADKP